MTKSLYATMRAQPEHRAEVARLLRDLARDVRAEPGCERFVVHVLADDPLLFHVEETYRNEAAFAAHMATAHGRAFNAAIAGLVEGGGSTVTFLTTIA